MNIRNFTDAKSLLLDNKSVDQTIFKNTFWLVIAETIQKGIGFLVVVWLARCFGPSIYGQWAFALSFVSLFAVLTDFGFSTLTVREIARDKSKISQYIDNIVVMKLILGLITLGLIVLIIQFLGKGPEVVKLVYFLGIYIVISTFTAFFQSIFRANEKMQYETICRTVQSLSLLGLISFSILNKGSILTISYAYLGAALIGVIVSLIIIWRYFSRFFLKIDLKISKEILRKAWPFGLSIIAVSIYYYLDSVMLGIMKSNKEVGWYNAAYRIIFLLLVFNRILISSFFPRLCKCAKEIKFKKIVDKYSKTTQFFAWPILLGGFILSDKIIVAIYGNKYSPAIDAFRILLLAVFLMYINIQGRILESTERQFLHFKIVVIGAICNIFFNFLFIPSYGLYGAAWATFLTELIVLSIMIFFTKKIFSIYSLLKNSIIPLASSIIMAAWLFLLLNTPFIQQTFSLYALLIKFSSGIIIYLFVYFIFEKVSVFLLDKLNKLNNL
ncbi:hypothetical protein DRN69_00785 [Candidatus Pacearchaeota archaeon]|nr:MAG: hypothetical protein DRN69_00785 [Candidatus Pacearchaeota archaeon]